MESNDRQPNERDPHVVVGLRSSHVVPGLFLVIIGGLFLLSNLHIVHERDWFAYWPAILIAIGLVQLVDATHTGARIAGGVLIGVGGIFLADNLGYLTFRVEDLWPLILIGVGVMMLINRLGWGSAWWGGSVWDRSWARSRARYERRGQWPGGWSGWGSRYDSQDTRDWVHEVSIFGGSRRTVVSQNFRGGRVSSVFGGVVLDLTGAQMSGNQAILDVAAIYGGVTVKVPPSWSVETRGAGVFGGFADHTIHPPYSPDSKRLVVKGAGVFGGVVIKN